MTHMKKDLAFTTRYIRNDSNIFILAEVHSMLFMVTMQVIIGLSIII